MKSNTPYSAHWLAPLEVPLANKFYRKYRFRGKAKSNESCAVVKTHTRSIIACGFIREYQTFKLLAGVAVAGEYQRRGICTLLLQHLYCRFDNDTYTFPYQSLVRLYQSFGFQTVDLQLLDNSIRNLYQRYINQGRDIVVMQFIGDTSLLTSN